MKKKTFNEFLRAAQLNEDYIFLSETENAEVLIAYIRNLLDFALIGTDSIRSTMNDKDFKNFAIELKNSIEDVFDTCVKFERQHGLDLDPEIPDEYKVVRDNKNDMPFLMKIRKDIFK